MDDPLGRKRLLALSIVAAGMLTFFCAFVTTDPSVASKSRWSPLDMVLQMYRGTLPAPVCERCSDPLTRSFLALPLQVAGEYLLLVFVLLAVCCRWPAKVVLSSALIGVYNSIRMNGVGTCLEFKATFYGFSDHGQVQYSELIAAHVVVMVALFLVSLELLEEESLPKAGRRDEFAGPRGPQVLDAEIVPEDEGAGKTRSNPRCLHD